MSELEVSFDSRRCSGFASCEIIAPDVFGLDDDTGKAFLLLDKVSAARRDALESAARSCPTNAIALRELL